jgi:hypothetical protein
MHATSLYRYPAANYICRHLLLRQCYLRGATYPFAHEVPGFLQPHHLLNSDFAFRGWGGQSSKSPSCTVPRPCYQLGHCTWFLYRDTSWAGDIRSNCWG